MLRTTGKILKENNKFDEVSFSIRYNTQEELIFTQLRRFLENHNVIYNFYLPKSANKMKYIIIIDDLEKISVNPYLLKDIHEKLGITTENFDYYFGIHSSFRIGGFSIPSSVLDFVRVLGGTIEFAYATY